MGRGSEGMGFGEGVSPFPIGGAGGLCPSPENFLTFWLKMVHFGIYSDKNSQLA